MDTSPEAKKRAFKQLLRKIGSGEHTSKGLTRSEADEAMELMLTGGASDVQIGAFLIAHRIRRPEPQELTGMLDTYKRLGPCLFSEPDQRRLQYTAAQPQPSSGNGNGSGQCHALCQPRRGSQGCGCAVAVRQR